MKKFISGGEYSECLETTRWPDDNRTTVDKIIEIFEYLKDKKTEEHSFCGKPLKIKNARLNFLRVALYRVYYSPYYNQATEEFLKSDYLSNQMKNEIYIALNCNCPKELAQLLNSERKMTEFSKEEIKAISYCLYKVSNHKLSSDKKHRCEDIYHIFDDYIFVIDGVGPIEYIKEKYTSELPSIMLEKSGVPSCESYYSGYGVDRRYLGEKHLFSLYKKVAKFYPDKTDDFIKMVNSISKLTPTEFVTNYLSFSRNGFDGNFKYKEGNTSLGELHGDARDLVSAVSIFTTINKSESNYDKIFQLDTQISIKTELFKMIDEYKKVQKSSYIQSNEKETSKVLCRK